VYINHVRINVENQVTEQFMFIMFCSEQKVVLHRGHVFNEFINYFIKHSPEVKGSKFVVEMILPNGTTEVAEDAGGVFRDALSEFWLTFYKGYTVGNHVKVPALVHTMTPEHWKSVASIIAVGYVQESYFPVELAIPFWDCCMTSMTTSADDDDLLHAFLLYVSDAEKDILVKALTEFDDVCLDDLTDTLDAYNVRVIPSKENISDIVHQVAHREIIQAPAYVAECWKEVFQTLTDCVTLDVRHICNDLTPNAKKILSILKVPSEANLGGAEKATLDYLRKFIRGLSADMMKLFLRYVTGNLCIYSIVGGPTTYVFCQPAGTNIEYLSIPYFGSKLVVEAFCLL
jgi:hypothetical protein